MSSTLPIFPRSAFCGTLGDLSYALTNGTEIPQEFTFAASLGFFGALLSGKVSLDIGLRTDTRLYTVLYGESAESKKSSAMLKVAEFFTPLVDSKVNTLYGVSSTEGLAKRFEDCSNIIVLFDELKSLTDKTAIKGSTLLAFITAMFEGSRWDSPVKDKNLSTTVRDGKLSLIGCCTADSYEAMWSSDSVDIGLHNRLFIVGGEKRPKVAWPRRADAHELKRIQGVIEAQLSSIPELLKVTPSAKKLWGDFYRDIPSVPHAKRIDTIGFRLMPTLAITMGKHSVDDEVVSVVTKLLNYELEMRQVSTPPDGANPTAKMEQKILAFLAREGPCDKRTIQQRTNGHRAGKGVFKTAFANLESEPKDIVCEGKLYRLVPQEPLL